MSNIYNHLRQGGILMVTFFTNLLAFGEGNSFDRIRPKHILNAVLSRIIS